jgi:GGDEF domain-containing protein
MSNPEEFPFQHSEGEEKKRELARAEFEQDFDKARPHLKEKMGTQEYEKLKNDWVAERMIEAEDLEDVNQVSENAIKEKNERRMDSVTGLERREEMYNLMRDKIITTLGLENAENLSPKELFKILNQESRTFRDKDMFILMADVSYLGLVNKMGHREGDRLLKEAGDATKKIGIRAFRHGGDEISGFLEFDGQEVARRIQALKDEFAKSGIRDKLMKNFKVNPHLDTGVAQFWEAFQVLKEIMDSSEGGEYFKKEDSLKELQDIWVEMADKRSLMNKAVERADVLAGKYDSDRDNYYNIIGALSKGVGEITEKEIELFVGKNKEHIKEYILDKKKKNIAGLKGYERKKEEAILNFLM